jgi:DNA-binding helix-hairpin-helix protein with protein kinase domain
MAALFTGNRPPLLQVDRSLIPVQGGNRVKTEILTISNNGGGILKGTASADVTWIRIPNPRIETPFLIPFRIEINPDRITPNTPHKGIVTVITNGGSAKIRVEFIAHPIAKPNITLDEPQYLFCHLRKGEDFSFDLIIKNTGTGLLSGTVESESDWIQVNSRTIWTQSIQAVPVIIHTAIAPQVRQPTGKIRIRSTGGNLEVPISVNFRGGDGPVIRLSSPGIRCVWNKRGIIEERFTIHNDGTGILRGTIPAPVPWLKINPSIFPVETSTKILLKIDTRMLTPDRSMSVPVQIITNAGTKTLTLEVIPGKQTPVPIRRNRVSVRQQPRTRLTVYEPDGKACILLSTGRAGGEGEIYFLAGDNTRCAKVFHPHRRTQEIEEKIRTMVTSPPDRELFRSLTWPLMPVTDLPRGGRIIGYLMRRIPDEFKSVHLWYDDLQGEDKRTLNCRIIAALRLARLVAGVHNAGHVIGDLRENNLLINKRGELILIDTDSFQIREKNSRRMFWSRVGTGEYLPPEHLNGSFAEAGCDRRYGDHFALAILIFRFMMDGVHPFQAKGPLVRDAPATTDKILLGHFAFESHLNGIAPPDYAPPYSSLPSPIRALFKEAFVSGLRSPHLRPDAARWEDTLKSLIPKEEKNQPKIQGKSVPCHQVPVTQIVEGMSESGGFRIQTGQTIFRTETGIIAEFGSGTQVFLPNNGDKISETTTICSFRTPPSLVLPIKTIYKGNSQAGWIIRAIDPGRYRPWHMIADPGSRNRSKSGGFYFNRRIAACRNLMAALISARQLRMPEIHLSERGVFVGSDASVRILCLPYKNGSSECDKGVSPVVMIFRMLMDGYHPFHATGSRTAGSGSHERRMALGLYPWADENPTLRPPPGAPRIHTLPKALRDLFEKEFRDFQINSKDCISIETWFKTLDQIYQRLIGCTINPDHWFLPDPGGCPWCNTENTKCEGIPLSARRFTPCVCLLLMTPKVAGLLQERNRRRRTRSPTLVQVTRWNTIHLPSERVIRIQLPPCANLITLEPGPRVQNFPVWYGKPYLSGIILERFAEGSKRGNEEEARIPDPHCEEREMKDTKVSQGMDDISLVDEMIWVSTMDRLRGEGIGQSRKRSRINTRDRSSGKRPIQIMLLPLNLPIPDTAADKHEKPEFIQQVQERTIPKKRTRKGIRARLQTILRDFIGGEDSD